MTIKQKPNTCSVCKIEISKYAKNCFLHKNVRRITTTSKSGIDPKWLVRGPISNNTCTSIFANEG